MNKSLIGLLALIAIFSSSAHTITAKYNNAETFSLCDDIGHCSSTVSGDGSVSMSVVDWVDMMCVHFPAPNYFVTYRVINPKENASIMVMERDATKALTNTMDVQTGHGQCPIIG